MSTLTLKQAQTIVEGALKKARETDSMPMTVAVLDAGGHLKAFGREDKAGIMRGDIATAKAYGSLGLGRGTRLHAGIYEQFPQFITALSGLAGGGKVVPVPGGVVIKDKDGDTIGAVGISGDTPVRDEECCVAGIEAAGLGSDTGA